MTIDELLADRDAGLRHLIHGMGFTDTQAAQLYQLLVDEHHEETTGGPGRPTPSRGQAGNWALAPRAVRAPGPQAAPAVGPAHTADRRRTNLATEVARCLWWTVVSWHRARRPALHNEHPQWTEPARINLQTLADRAEGA